MGCARIELQGPHYPYNPLKQFGVLIFWYLEQLISPGTSQVEVGPFFFISPTKQNYKIILILVMDGPDF